MTHKEARTQFPEVSYKDPGRVPNAIRRVLGRRNTPPRDSREDEIPNDALLVVNNETYVEDNAPAKTDDEQDRFDELCRYQGDEFALSDGDRASPRTS